MRRPFSFTSCFIDLLIINILAYYMPIQFSTPMLFHSYVSITWIGLVLKTGVYDIDRHTKVFTLVKKHLYQFGLFFFFLYAFIGFFKQPIISRLALGKYFVLVFLVVLAVKFCHYLIIRRYRRQTNKGFSTVVVLGGSNKANQLTQIFDNKKEFGYTLKKQFFPSDQKFSLSDFFSYIIDNKVDELYCSTHDLTDNQIVEIINFSDHNLKILKFIPDNKNIFSKKLKFEYYDYIPILSMYNIALHNPINAFFKRIFDVFFSLAVIVFILSWLTPLLIIVMKIESKGAVFFKQKRNGFNNNVFYCYKFRSMAPDKDSTKYEATKEQVAIRVTKVGRFIRKTSIDELPQFFNVLSGEMSVVGPRPHMISDIHEFTPLVNKNMMYQKFMFRHFVKPGITGLAQTRGYRGSIKQKSDIINRTKLDIFYIENWSFLLDLKIILDTIFNVFKGDEKAY